MAKRNRLNLALYPLISLTLNPTPQALLNEEVRGEIKVKSRELWEKTGKYSESLILKAGCTLESPGEP